MKRSKTIKKKFSLQILWGDRCVKLLDLITS